ncbi:MULTISPECIES: hypothetical protein [unclassified Gordonia (in: high G+C Gram-positive bacteria)]|uniref:hypothetical protein n=1 Tax=Gordonia TaxID=2053 RepID=UPI0009689FAC|nr:MULTISPECIES: hypothetical protein [unclassified Gordonia (in: high G+C Gram-positive bacteria)]MBR7193833.1 hypothetical protein [Gordonia sp. SCSIO 19800]MCR8897709.1 hypothetical protein [Gordonia sp. GONU]OLT52966.1 hypothetical protein BJF87_12900 [Gordonia sp. CNJ-863]
MSSLNISFSPTAVFIFAAVTVVIAGAIVFSATCTALWSSDPAQREHARLVLADLLHTVRVLGRGDNGEPRS